MDRLVLWHVAVYLSIQMMTMPQDRFYDTIFNTAMLRLKVGLMSVVERYYPGRSTLDEQIVRQCHLGDLWHLYTTIKLYCSL